MESIRKVAASNLYPSVQDEVARLAGSAEVHSAFDRFRSRESQFALWQMEATRVAAPPFGEAARGAWLADRFRELGLTEVQVDDVGNVFGVRPGYGSRFVGNVGEEGEGDLRGMRHVFATPRWRDAIAYGVVVDGAGADTVVSEALGSRRFEVMVRGPGGHSWSDFGAPNPIIALSRAIEVFSQTPVPASPKTT